MSSITLLHWITLTSILFWLAAYWQGGRKVMVDIKEAIRARKSHLDMVLLMVIAFCSLVLITLGVWASLGHLQIIPFANLAVILPGTVFVVFGIIGMFYCRHYLGKFWTAETNLTHDHQIIDTGPYHFVRHPIYTFAIIMYSGFGLVFPSLWSALLAGAIVIAYILKTKDEDNFLEKNLAGYREYRSRVKYHLIPGLW